MAIAKALGGTDPKFWLTLDARFQMTKVLIKDRDRERERAGQSSPDFEAVPAPDPG